MPFVSGFLRIRRAGQPDQGLPPGSPGAPDQGLPGEPPVPDQGLARHGIPRSGAARRRRPASGRRPTISHPIVPAPPVTPLGRDLAAAAADARGRRDPTRACSRRERAGLPPGSPGAPDQTLPGDLPGPSHPIALPPDKFWIVAGIPGYGWTYVCVQPQPAHADLPRAAGPRPRADAATALGAEEAADVDSG